MLFGINGAIEAVSRGDIIIAVDVLRASSTITTALNNGAEKVIVVKEVEEAFRLSKIYGNSILAGERRGLKIKGFALGNSPLEYNKNVIKGKTVIFTSSNCAPLIEVARKARLLMLGCYLNISSLVKYANEKADEMNTDISIVHAGRYGAPCSDDLLCAEIIQALLNGELAEPPNPSLIKKVLLLTPSGRYLSSIGYKDDVIYCGNIDTINIVPVWVENGFISNLRITSLRDADRKVNEAQNDN